ncbi:hypothetical protein MNBD_GAMMA13-1436 [hydrothermal vent metagenome]|uniref:Uncharacterized protein n=1 Tax=hydrothermal vent metagenome TaxID=652676 RepID=A0A3B0YEN5_9ZZZZ
MNYSVILYNSPIMVDLSKRAEQALVDRSAPLIAEIHLIFGCLVVKRVWFKEQVMCKTVPVNDQLELCFNVVRYAKTCCIADIDNGAIPEDFPLVREIDRFVPDSLSIDFRKGKFSGTFAYNRALRA